MTTTPTLASLTLLDATTAWIAAAADDPGRRLAGAVAELPEKYRRPLLLKEIEGMTYAEIAELLGWPMGTVQIRIHRARIRLRERAAKLLGTGETP